MIARADMPMYGACNSKTSNPRMLSWRLGASIRKGTWNAYDDYFVTMFTAVLSKFYILAHCAFDFDTPRFIRLPHGPSSQHDVTLWIFFWIHEQSDAFVFLISPIKISGYTQYFSNSFCEANLKPLPQLALTSTSNCIHEEAGKYVIICINWY